MEYGYITFRSVTHAQRGERILESTGIRCGLQRTPRWMEEQGCGYCLRLRSAQLHRAGLLLDQAGVAFRKLYTPDGAGELKEAAL